MKTTQPLERKSQLQMSYFTAIELNTAIFHSALFIVALFQRPLLFPDYWYPPQLKGDIEI